MDSYTNEFNIRGYHSRDCKAVCHVANAGFGNGYLQESQLEKLADRTNGMFFVAEYGERIVGYCIFLESTTEEIAHTMQLEPDEVLRLSGGNHRACIIKSMSVASDMERKGIAGALFQATLHHMQTLAFSGAWGSAWMIAGQIPMEAIFDRHHFAKYGIRQMLWYEDEDYCCHVCKGRCKCDAMIYYRQFR